MPSINSVQGAKPSLQSVQQPQTLAKKAAQKPPQVKPASQVTLSPKAKASLQTPAMEKPALSQSDKAALDRIANIQLDNKKTDETSSSKLQTPSKASLQSPKGGPSPEQIALDVGVSAAKQAQKIPAAITQLVS